jgi:hypothetical protein
MKRNIFLSYGHDKYAPNAFRIKEDLEKRGHVVWYDPYIPPGKDWEETIEEKIRWCDLVILVMTPHSVRRKDREDPRSEYGYCLNELAKAIHEKKLIIPILLVYLDDGPPTSICRIQYLDLQNVVPIDSHEEKYSPLLERLLKAVEEEDLDFEGGQATLIARLQPLDFTSDIRPHIAKFIGRTFILGEIDAWLHDPKGKKNFWLIGDPGIGKTALSAYIGHYWREIVAFHFCIHNREDKGDPNRMILSIAYQLSQHFPHYGKKIQNYDYRKLAVMRDTQTLCDHFFIQPFAKDFPVPEHPVCILIDAIDEVSQDDHNPIAEFIRDYGDQVPSWIRFIITSRRDPRLYSILSSLDPYVFDAHNPQNVIDIQNYLRTEFLKRDIAVPEDVIKKIVELSEGIFLYAEWVIREIEGGRLTLDRVDAFPQGLDGIYLKYFKRLFPDVDRYDAEYRPILECICAERDPLPLSFLKTATGLTDMKLRMRLLNIGSLFPIDRGVDDQEEAIRPFHKSITDWLTEKNREGYPKAGRYAIEPDEGAFRLMMRCWKEYEDLGIIKMSSYSFGCLSKYLLALVTSPRYTHIAAQKGDILEKDRDFINRYWQEVTGYLNEALPKEMHEQWVREMKSRGIGIDENPLLVPWDNLSESYKEENRRVAKDVPFFLKSINCIIVPRDGISARSEQFTFYPEEIEVLAKLEHDSWAKDRLQKGWKYGPVKDYSRKTSPYLCSYSELDEYIKDYDRNVIRQIPLLLAEIGYSVIRIRTPFSTIP